jgi:predicted aconitase
MHLTNEEEHIYDGESGWADQICMRILVRLGDLFGATKLITIGSAHVSGVSYKTLGDAPIEFLRTLADSGGKTRVKATLNPQGLDSDYLRKKLQGEVVEKQSTILKQFERMGFLESLTCTPYYLEKPKPGSHLAWAESSAVVYTNSILGAWTNREGGPSALAAAVIGKTPNYGVHKAKNREPQVLVNVNAPLQAETEFGALGIYLGKILEEKIPVIRGLRTGHEPCLKQLGAALASSGMVNMFYSGQGRRIRTKRMEKMSIDSENIKQTIRSLSTASAKPDLVFIGCPHCSLDETISIAELIGNRKVKPGTEFWICTSRYVKEIAKEYVARIEKSGGHVLEGVCTVVSWTEKLGIKTIMTNSAKTAYYAPTLNKAETILAPLKQCMTAAFKG